jgi:nucleosome assembly protein 1-like 1
MPPKGKQPKMPEPEPEEEEDEEILDGEGAGPKKTPVEILNELPLIQRKAIYALKANHAKIREIRAKYDADLKALESKYMKLSFPLLEERRKIVMGEREVTAEEIAAGETVTKSTSKVEAVEEVEPEEENRPRRGVGAKNAKAKTADAPVAPAEDTSKGIPDFWLTALTNNEVTMDSVTPRDREALSALQDVSFQYIDDDPFKGYVLTFTFGDNRFFSDRVLTKKYFQERDNDQPILAKTEGTKINWKSKGDNLTVMIKKKQQKHRTKKTVRTIEQEVKCDSFFNFFDPPRIPQEGDPEDEDDDEVDYEELEERIEYDYEVGNAFKDRIIPKAVDYFTGAALQIAGLGGLMGGEDAPTVTPVEPTTETRAAVAPARGGRGGGSAGNKQEDCKQQ